MDEPPSKKSRADSDQNFSTPRFQLEKRTSDPLIQSNSYQMNQVISKLRGLIRPAPCECWKITATSKFNPKTIIYPSDTVYPNHLSEQSGKLYDKSMHEKR
uniref:Uncharacterized protein n=1 Tax=Caenorhabditis japonica TaxID=281687 RepID=A0A8R1EU25_CAEJA